MIYMEGDEACLRLQKKIDGITVRHSGNGSHTLEETGLPANKPSVSSTVERHGWHGWNGHVRCRCAVNTSPDKYSTIEEDIHAL